jgi:hypothetical protein
MSSATATIYSKKKRQSSGNCFGVAKGGSHENQNHTADEILAHALRDTPAMKIAEQVCFSRNGGTQCIASE